MRWPFFALTPKIKRRARTLNISFRMSDTRKNKQWENQILESKSPFVTTPELFVHCGPLVLPTVWPYVRPFINILPRNK